ncbi:hypothetical protein ACWDYK_37410 [Streptomyces anthocyanicus]
MSVTGRPRAVPAGTAGETVPVDSGPVTALSRLLADGITEAPPSVSPLQAVAAGLERASSAMGPANRELGPRLKAAVAASAELQERDTLHQAPTDSGVAPLIIGRAVSSAVTLAAAGLLHRRLGPARPAHALSATAGALDSLANLLFLLAARSGDFTVVAVMAHFQPAGDHAPVEADEPPYGCCPALAV